MRLREQCIEGLTLSGRPGFNPNNNYLTDDEYHRQTICSLAFKILGCVPGIGTAIGLTRLTCRTYNVVMENPDCDTSAQYKYGIMRDLLTIIGLGIVPLCYDIYEDNKRYQAPYSKIE